MTDNKGIALLIMHDDLVRKGLELLLSDLSYRVISATSENELIQKINSIPDYPDLLLFPVQLDNQPAIYLVRKFRKQFNHTIPAVLLSDSTNINELLFTDSCLSVLPDQTKPSILRKKIIELTTCSS